MTNNKEYDKNRDDFLTCGNYIVLRFTNHEIENALPDVLEKIRKTAASIKKK